MSSLQQACKRDAYLEVNARKVLKTLLFTWFLEPCSKPRKCRMRKNRTLLRVEGSRGQSSYSVIMLAKLWRRCEIDTSNRDLKFLSEFDPHSSRRNVCIRVVCQSIIGTFI